MNVVIRADSSLNIGTGHIMRCLTLADELKAKGASVSFICREEPGNLIEFIENKGYTVFRLPPDIELSADKGLTRELLKEQATIPELLIIDHYALDKQWEEGMRLHVNKIMVIDDLADRKHDCDLLLDQNLYEDMENRYDELLPESCVKLLGPKYALLRREFAEPKENLKMFDGTVNRILIFFGGSDSTNETAKALEAVRMLNRPDIAVDVVVGKTNPHKEKIKELCSELPNAHFYCQVDNMAELMSEADLSIGAGGTTTWERCSAGLPSFVVTTAKNQENLTGTMAEKGYLLYLGPSEWVSANLICKSLETVLHSPWLLKSFAQNSQNLVDGKGTERLALAMMPGDITLRHATIEDCELVYRWRNAEENRRYSLDNSPISLERHRKWFKHTIGDPDRILLIGELNKRPVGVLRYDLKDDSAIISVYLVPGNHGKGIGPQLIRSGSDWLHLHFPHINVVHAEVRSNNVASAKAFINAGYSEYRLIFEDVIN